ncbi:MAG: phosphoglycerate mutase [Rhodoferax sp.]|nr:phosphoglycerate mutase [Rhodoferax sp.]
MHLLIPYAYCHQEACRQAFHRLALPKLRQLLTRLRAEAVVDTDGGDEWTLSPPHERVHARALGLPSDDGRIPWAAWQALHAPPPQSAELASRGAWGFLSPCYWQAGMDRLTMQGPNLPELTEAESHALMGTLAQFMQQDGIALHFDRPDRWRIHGELLRELATASLDRVLGQDLAPWLTRQGDTTAWQRLQSELQMLLYAHPVNDERAARGAPIINAVWLHGTGNLPERYDQAVSAESALIVADSLRARALTQDWPAWGRAWQELDATLCDDLLARALRGDTVRLSLCGQRQARAWVSQAPALSRRLRALFGAAPDLTPLDTL